MDVILAMVLSVCLIEHAMYAKQMDILKKLILVLMDISFPQHLIFLRKWG
jgi:hypothetical protein